MNFTELNKLNAEVTDAYEVLQVTKQNVFASIHARHEKLQEAMESLAKTMEANTDDDDIDDQLDAISNDLDELLRSMEE